MLLCDLNGLARQHPAPPVPLHPGQGVQHGQRDVLRRARRRTCASLAEAAKRGVQARPRPPHPAAAACATRGRPPPEPLLLLAAAGVRTAPAGQRGPPPATRPPSLPLPPSTASAARAAPAVEALGAGRRGPRGRSLIAGLLPGFPAPAGATRSDDGGGGCIGPRRGQGACCRNIVDFWRDGLPPGTNPGALAACADLLFDPRPRHCQRGRVGPLRRFCAHRAAGL